MLKSVLGLRRRRIFMLYPRVFSNTGEREHKLNIKGLSV